MLVVQRFDGSSQLLRWNRGYRLCQQDMGCSVDIKDRIEFADRRERLGLRYQCQHHARCQLIEQTSLQVHNVACTRFARHAIDVETRYQNWRNWASGNPCRST